MLRIASDSSTRTCDGLHRRDFLRAGAIGAGGLTLPGLLRTRAFAADSAPGFVRDRAVVLLYLSGGASHIETFNPNMDQPEPYRSVTGEVATSVTGVTFGGTFPRLARHADKMAIVRSFQHRVGGHEQAHVHVLSGSTDPRGDQKSGFSIGSLCTRLRGTNHPETGMPTYSLLLAPEVDGQYRKEFGRVIKGSWPGELGASYGPLHHGADGDGAGDRKGKKSRRRTSRRGDGGSLTGDLELNVPLERLDDRRALLAELDRLKRRWNIDGELAGGFEAFDRFREQAIELVLGGASKAFDLSEESPKLVERYDTSGTLISHKKFRKSTLGTQMLLARRLCEAGCGFVTVHSAGWDMHADGNNPGMVKGMNMLGVTIDKAVSAFLEDLEERGLSEKILLVITGDFGRTPKVNKKGGRDHWARLGTLAFAGGGLPGGAVVGRADRQNGAPASEPITPGNMMATILHSLFDIGKLRVARGIPREILAVVEGEKPIRGLV